MGESVKVTVAMGVYEPRNLEQLRLAVGSILDQTCGDWELLLYDDGSREPWRRAHRLPAPAGS